ncbi:V-type proton ATPase subunit S1 [Eumeta japonica]|uniref:V-type proton ATPase subunit S1 n=1 Tax=Eumeta variegata TaxID=151549 RepID=A0A4C1V3Y2_EUMVA|nr:V-type proton ATPase subunit S1 [Eumeta japonica]
MIHLINSPTKAQSGVPVFIIDYENQLSDLKIAANPFDEMKSTKFVDLVHLIIKKSERVVIFVENKLSAEDISFKDALGTPYVHLSKHLDKKKLVYIPSVHQPHKILKRIFQPQQYNVLYLRFVKNPDISDNYRYYYVHFEDVFNETRTEKLRRHDEIMQDVYEYISTKIGRGVLAIYTALENPIVAERFRGRSLHRGVHGDSGTTMSSEGGLIHLRGVSTSTLHRTNFLQPPTIRDENYDADSNRIYTKIAFNNFDLQFNFSLHPNHWVLDSIGIMECGKEVGSVQVRVGTAYRNSYVCGVPLKIINKRDDSVVTISHYQVQTYHPETIKRLLKRSRSLIDGNDPAIEGTSHLASEGVQRVFEENGKFGDAEHCTSFFTPAILAGLMVSFLCFSIMMWGILMIMDLKTMDKFDDPRSNKPLVINVTE